MRGLRARTAARAAAWGVAAGALFAVSCLCYLPRFALVAVPIGVLFVARRRRDLPLTAASAALLGTTGLVAGASVAWLAAYDLLGALVEAIRFQAQSPALSTPLAPRIAGLLRTEAARALPSAAAYLAFGVCLLAAVRRSVASLWVGLLASAAMLAPAAVYVHHGDKSVPAYALVYTGLCWLPLVAYPFLWRRLRVRRPEAAVATGVLFLVALGQQAIAGVTSTQGAAAGIPGLAASLVLLLLLWESVIPAEAAPRRLARQAAAALCAGLAANAAAFHFYAEQNPLRVETRAFARDGSAAFAPGALRQRVGSDRRRDARADRARRAAARV